MTRKEEKAGRKSRRVGVGGRERNRLSRLNHCSLPTNRRSSEIKFSQSKRRHGDDDDRELPPLLAPEEAAPGGTITTTLISFQPTTKTTREGEEEEKRGDRDTTTGNEFAGRRIGIIITNRSLCE